MKYRDIKVINKNKTQKIEEEKIRWVIEKIAKKYSSEIVELVIKNIKDEN